MWSVGGSGKCVCDEWRGEWWLCTSFFTLTSSYPHTLTLSQPQRLWTSFQKLLIAQMTELRNWCVYVCMCDVCVWCVYVCMCVGVCMCACVMCVWCVYVCMCDVMCGVCIVSYDVASILNPALPFSPSLSLPLPFLPLSRKTPIQFSRSSDHCKTMKGPCLGLAEYFSKREC